MFSRLAHADAFLAVANPETPPTLVRFRNNIEQWEGSGARGEERHKWTELGTAGDIISL